jgi:ribonucleoside-diphosphate reductase beta chain
MLRKQKEKYILLGTNEDLIGWAEQQKANIWFANQADYSTDRDNKTKLSPDVLKFLVHTLLFFAAGDGIVNENIEFNMYREFENEEVRAVYSVQQFMETEHQRSYSDLLKVYAPSVSQALTMMESLHEYEGVQAKLQWCEKWMNHPNKTKRLFAYILVEGLMFQGSFASIFYLKTLGHVLDGLYFVNAKIQTDERDHADFGVYLYNTVVGNGEDTALTQEEAEEIVLEALHVEQMFYNEAVPIKLIGMNEQLMTQYLQCVADGWLKRMGYKPIFDVPNPFHFMETLGVTTRTNFFDGKVDQYQDVRAVSTMSEIDFNDL